MEAYRSIGCKLKNESVNRISGTVGDYNYRSRLMVSNPGPESSVLRAQIFDRFGRPLPLPALNSELDLSEFDVPDAETVHLEPVPGMPAQHGWLDLEVRGPGQVSLELSTWLGAQFLSSTLISAAKISNHLVGSAIWDPDTEESTALALVNPFPDHFLTIAVLIRDADLRPLGFTILGLRGKQSQSFCLHELLLERNALQGAVIIDSSQPFAASLFRTRQGCL